MTGVVVFRMPMMLVQLRRSQLALVTVKGSALKWLHIGESKHLELDADVLADDDDTSDYAAIAQAMYDSIANQHTHQNVTWTWNANDKKWNFYVAPLDVNLAGADFIDDEMIGFGSLGR